MADKEALRSKLLEHELVRRALRNPNWKPAAMAAVAFFVDGKECTVTSWAKSSTWAQVRLAYEELLTNS